MNLSDPAGRQSLDDLREHLAPELFEYLEVEGDLPAGVLRAECSRLRAELAALASYVPAPIVREQIAQPQPGRVCGAYWDGSILFADLSGFTALSERLSQLGKQGAEEISAIINRLFAALVEETHRYQGALLKFGGDALTAFFDAALLGPAHAALAARAALAMQRRMAEFAALRTRDGAFTLRLRIGVHSGRVFAAQVGSLEHIELVVTGHNINRVAQAQEIAEPGEVVISDATRVYLADALVAPRHEGFVLLRELAAPDALPDALPELWPAGAGDLAELLALASQIAALRPYLPRHLPRRFLEPGSAGEAGEFRTVTTLFAHVAPFSAALDLLGDDAQTAALLLNAYYRRAQEVIHRYGGIVNKVDMYTRGDKLMALFGAPVANEDDPQRAVRAALDMAAALEAANAEIAATLGRWHASGGAAPAFQLTQRIGLNTGMVFAGKVGSATRHEYTVMGQHVNLAARLMSVAPEGQVILSPSTCRAAERHFELHALPAVRLKGVAAPVPIAQALRPRSSVQAAWHAEQFDPLVGRDAELKQLLETAQLALSGSGRVVALVGETGSGKSRLIDTALRQLLKRASMPDSGTPAFFSYIVECQSYDQSTPYAALRDLLRQLFSLSQLASVAEMVAEVRSRAGELAPELERFVPLLGDVLGLPLPETTLTAALTPEQRHARTHELVEALLFAEARQGPLLLILDDLQWCDASSLEQFERLAAQAPRGAMLLLLGYRTDPPIAEPWRTLPHVARLTLGDLAPEASAQLVRQLLRGEPSPELIALIEKAQGNPLFIGEVVRSLIESGALKQAEGRWQLGRAFDESTIPDGVEGLITARLDRLEEQLREVLQVAAVVGRRFLYPVLSGVVLRDDGLIEKIHRLSDADLIAAEERDLTYMFRHALTRDVAYESILYARRRELHRRVAAAMELLLGDRADDQLALLGRHYLLAEEWEPAFRYHLRAGRQAQARFANREAIALFERALQITSRMTADNVPLPPAEILIEIYERLGVVHALIGEYDTALMRYEEALWQLEKQPDAELAGLVRLHHHIARVYEKRASFDEAFKWVERALQIGGDQQSVELARCLQLGAGLHRRQGRYQQALEWGERALAVAQQIGSQRDQAHAYMLLGGTYRNLGNNQRALELTTSCLALYEQAQDLVRLADGHNEMAITYYELGRLSEARQHYEAGAEIKRAIGDVYGQAMIANNLGNLLKLQGQIAAAVEQFTRSLAIFQQLGSRYATGVLHMNLGAAQTARGDLESAAQHLDQSAALFAEVGAEDFLPELERYRAELEIGRGDLAAARRACDRSLEQATRLAARAEEGMSRRVLGEILAASDDMPGAWEQLAQSLSLLRAAQNTHEVARTLLAQADLAAAVGQPAAGQQALAEAVPLLQALGAQDDLARAQRISAAHGYAIEAPVALA